MNNTIPVTTKIELKYSKSVTPTVIPTGTNLNLYFDGKSTIYAYFNHEGVTRPLRITNLHKYFGSRFKKMPSISYLQKQELDGVCSTVNGKRVEPDGFDEFGAPSWLLVLGLI